MPRASRPWSPTRCADDTKGQTCFICTQALHWKTKEGLVRMCACRGTAGFAHVSCLAEQAKILFAEAEENNLGDNAFDERWDRWFSCSLCEQEYHGVTRCALGWACWKTYVGRPEGDWARGAAMMALGNGLYNAKHYEDAFAVKEAELAMLRRLGDSEENILIVQGNLACTYGELKRLDEALSLRRDVYSRRLKLNGEEHSSTIRAANNYASSLLGQKRFEEAKALFRRTIPVARRVLGDHNDLTLLMRRLYAVALCNDPGATLDDLREAIETFEETGRIARRVLGSAHPLTKKIENALRQSRAALRACETPSAG